MCMPLRARVSRLAAGTGSDILASILRIGGCVRAALRAGQACKRMKRLVRNEAGAVWCALYGPYVPAGLPVRTMASLAVSFRIPAARPPPSPRAVLVAAGLDLGLPPRRSGLSATSSR